MATAAAMVRSIPLIVLAALVSVAAAKDPSTTLLNEWPMVMVHDAATTYLKGGILHQINNWAKTQADGGAAGELECGARAFDWRPKLKDGKLIGHHGSIDVTHTFEDSLDEMVAWAESHNNTQDLVVLGLTDCDGDGCSEAVQAALGARGIQYATDCGELHGLTAAAAAERARLPAGGAIFAIFDCWEENYVPEIACSGFGSTLSGDAPLSAAELERAGELRRTGGAGLQRPGLRAGALMYTCYADSATKDFPMNRMLRYLEAVAAAGAPADGRLFAAQAVWQETVASVAVGELHGSSLLGDVSKSELNSLLAGRIASGAWNGTLNLVEVNNVCDGGAALLAALRALP